MAFSDDLGDHQLGQVHQNHKQDACNNFNQIFS